MHIKISIRYALLESLYKFDDQASETMKVYFFFIKGTFLQKKDLKTTSALLLNLKYNS